MLLSGVAVFECSPDYGYLSEKKKREATSCTQHQHAESHAAFMVKHLRIMVKIKIVLLCDADVITALRQQ